MNENVAGPLYSGIKNITHAEARGLVCSYFKDWRPDVDFIVKLVQAVPREDLEKIINDNSLKTIHGYNKDEKLVID